MKRKLKISTLLGFFVLATCGCTQPIKPTSINAERIESSSPQSARITHIEHEPRPGENFGLLKDESAKALEPDVRIFLDGVLRLYKEPSLIGDRKASLTALGVKVLKRYSFPTEGQPRPIFRENLAPFGVLKRQGWKGFVYYSGTEKENSSWLMRIEFEISPEKAACVQSRAVEGYLENIFWHPVVGGTLHNPGWKKEDWDRHARFGGVFAKRLTSTSPEVWLDFVNSCLARVLISGNFLFGEMDDEQFYN